MQSSVLKYNLLFKEQWEVWSLEAWLSNFFSFSSDVLQKGLNEMY